MILKPPPADIQDLYLASAAAPSASTPPSTTCASRRTTGSRPRSARGASAGRCCSTARRSRSSPTSSRRAASTWRRSRARSPTGSSGSRCTCRRRTTSTTSSGPGRTLSRGAPRGGVPALALLVRARRRRAPPATSSRARSPRAGPLLEVPDGRAYLPAYDWALKSSHAFNVLDARGAISVSERAGMILRIRKLACAVARAYVDAVTGGPPPRRPGVAELLIEIGFEEMPAPWLPGLAEQLRHASGTRPHASSWRRRAQRSPGRRGGWC